VLPGEQPALVRNYDYDQALFEAVIASTDYSGRRRVLGTSDMLWGLLDGMNEDGLAVSLTFSSPQSRLSMDIGDCPWADMGIARWWPLRTAQWRT
jgi:predicted choloylglycine hydrolase